MENTNDIFKIETESPLVLSLSNTNTSSTPFSVTFSWRENMVTVELTNGEDILKLADVLSKVLTENNIEHKII